MADSIICRDDQRIRRVDCRHCGIRHLMLFSTLDVETYLPLLQPIRNIRAGKGEVIYREAESSATVVSIRRGLVKLEQALDDGSRRIVRIIGPGATIGLEALLGEPLQQTAVALSEIDICLIPVPSLLELDARSPELHRELMGKWQDQVEQADRLIAEINTGTVRERVIRLLFLLGDMAAIDQSAPVLVSTEDIAAAAATTKESASRVMADLRRRGLLVRQPGGRFRYDDTALRAELATVS